VKLDELLASLDVRTDGDLNVEITGLSYDSRQSKRGHLFFSMARDAEKNRANVSDALSRGARAVVVRGWDDVELARPAVTWVGSERPRLLMGAVAARFFGAPSERVDLIGITGTSGKTTTSYILGSIFEVAGMPAGIIGTIGIFVAGKKIYSGLTTPESLDFESALAQMEREGVRHAAAEVSSIGLAEGRVDALNFRACMFTNLGRDHLDYHGTIENYFAAKLRLFTEILPRSKRANTVAIVRGDDPFGRRVLDAVKTPKVSFGMDRSLDVYPESFEADLSGIHATLSVLGKKIKIDSPLIGEINLLNILGASGLSAALGIELVGIGSRAQRVAGGVGYVHRRRKIFRGQGGKAGVRPELNRIVRVGIDRGGNEVAGRIGMNVRKVHDIGPKVEPDVLLETRDGHIASRSCPHPDAKDPRSSCGNGAISAPRVRVQHQRQADRPPQDGAHRRRQDLRKRLHGGGEHGGGLWGNLG